jgi:putative flippase GtrA
MNGKTSLSLDALERGRSAGAPVGRDARRAINEFARYFVASAGALAVDVGLYRLGLWLGWHYQLAALLGFCAGAVIAYLASVRWVFHARTVHNAGLEFGLFVAVGVAGLLLTELLLWIAIGTLGLQPLWSKLGTSAVVFGFNFILRKALLFSTQAADRRGQGAAQVPVERAL